MKIGLFFQEITFITEFPDSNFLLPTFLTGGKWDFQVAELLLATVNFEPWDAFRGNYNLLTFMFFFLLERKFKSFATNLFHVIATVCNYLRMLFSLKIVLTYM